MAIKTAVIGLGIMGQRMLEHLERHPDYDTVAIWDPDERACVAAHNLCPNATLAEDAEAAIAMADLVYLACPPRPRKAYAIAAAKQGKAVFLEKPFGVDAEGSAELLERLAKSGVSAAVNFTQAAGKALTDVSQTARSGGLGELVGVDIVLTYGAWPRTWQKQADWLRFRDEGGMTREVLSHFLFFSERILGPLSVVWARPSYPQDPRLCETHMLARLENEQGLPVAVMASVGGAQPDRQELTVKGTTCSRRITDFYVDAQSDGGDFVELGERPSDPRAESLRAQLDDLRLCIAGKPHRLATADEAYRVQVNVEAMLQGRG